MPCPPIPFASEVTRTMRTTNTPGSSSDEQPAEKQASTRRMATTGRWTVVAILGAAVVLGLANFVYQQRRTARSVEYWGPSHRALIVGEQAEVMLLESVPWPPKAADTAAPAASSAERDLFIVDGRAFRIVKSKDGRHARGLLHVRRALLDDGAYHWDPSASAQPPDYRYAIRFGVDDGAAPSQPNQPTVVLFNRDGTWIQGLHAARPLAVRNNAQGVPPFAAFLAEQFPEVDQATDQAALRDPQPGRQPPEPQH